MYSRINNNPILPDYLLLDKVIPIFYQVISLLDQAIPIFTRLSPTLPGYPLLY